MEHTRIAHRGRQPEQVSNFLFGLFIYFTMDFFMHFSARIPFYGLLRPTLVLTFVIGIMLYAQKDRFTDHTSAPAFRALLVLLMYVVLSLPLVKWPGSVLRENVPEFVKAVSFFFFAALILDSEKRLRTFMFVFLGCQLLRVLEPLFLHIFTGYWGGATYAASAGTLVGRLGGAPADIIGPNELSFVIVTLVPYLYYLLWCSRSKLAKLLFVVIAPTIIYAQMLTMSRGGFIALMVVGWFILRDSRYKFVMILAALAMGAALWSNMTPVQKERYLSIFSSDTSQSATVTGRYEGMKEEFSVGMKRPIFGHGVGTTMEAKWHAIRSKQASHNLYSELLIEIGAIGFFLFFRYLVAMYQSFRANREKLETMQAVGRDSYRSRMNNAMIAVFWMYLVFSLNYWGLSVYYWYLFGGLTVAFSRVYFSNVEETAAQPEPERAPRHRHVRRGIRRGMGRT